MGRAINEVKNRSILSIQMKLHLGCGQRYLKGYINIDFPASEHTVQDKSIADIQADITQLSYPASTIDEVRLHHVFEHFTRPVACGLLVAWRSWLKIGGTLRIEVPDSHRMSLIISNPLTLQRSKTVALRHMFGSHEARWAIHCEGWTIDRLTKILKTLGFAIIKCKKNSWKGTYNFEIIGKKNDTRFSNIDIENNVKGFLSDYLVDLSQSELKLLDVWIKAYKNQLHNCLARGE